VPKRKVRKPRLRIRRENAAALATLLEIDLCCTEDTSTLSGLAAKEAIDLIDEDFKEVIGHRNKLIAEGYGLAYVERQEKKI